GNNSGVGIGCVSWDGEVHPDQFWRHVSFGNVRERPFSEIWLDTSNELMAGLKNRRSLIKGRCAGCRWLDICAGNFRARAEAVTGDPWASDPACYLTDCEIGRSSEH
ncbi:MAG: SPASM domain-containing protein, partial [Syntrophales bacterium]